MGRKPLFTQPQIVRYADQYTQDALNGYYDRFEYVEFARWLSEKTGRVVPDYLPRRYDALREWREQHSDKDWASQLESDYTAFASSIVNPRQVVNRYKYRSSKIIEIWSAQHQQMAQLVDQCARIHHDALTLKGRVDAQKAQLLYQIEKEKKRYAELRKDFDIVLLDYENLKKKNNETKTKLATLKKTYGVLDILAAKMHLSIQQHSVAPIEFTHEERKAIQTLYQFSDDAVCGLMTEFPQQRSVSAGVMHNAGQENIVSMDIKNNIERFKV